MLIPSTNRNFGWLCSKFRKSWREFTIIRFTIISGTYGGTVMRSRPFGAILAFIDLLFAERYIGMSPNSLSLMLFIAYRNTIFEVRSGTGFLAIISIRGPVSQVRTIRTWVACVCLPLTTSAFSVS